MRKKEQIFFQKNFGQVEEALARRVPRGRGGVKPNPVYLYEVVVKLGGNGSGLASRVPSPFTLPLTDARGTVPPSLLPRALPVKQKK